MTPKPPDPHVVLGVKPDASPEAVRAAYRRLVRTYHPDRYARDPAVRRLAEARLREVNQAYEALVRRRGRPSPRSANQAPPRSVCRRHAADYIGVCAICGAPVCARCRRPGGCASCRIPRSPSAFDRTWPWVLLAADVFVARRLGWSAAVAGFSVLAYLACLGIGTLACRRASAVVLGLLFPYALVAAGLLRLFGVRRRAV
jgi:hypothetical protein